MEQQFYNDSTIARAHAEDEFFQQPRSHKQRRNLWKPRTPNRLKPHSTGWVQ
jgi:hypothetical protein